MFIFIIRSVIIYVLLLFVVRLMGKRQIGELQPFELVIMLIIAELSILPLQEAGMSLVNSIVPLFTLVSVHYIISLISMKSIFARKLICGKPFIIINSDGIQYEQLKKLSINISDLEENLRNAGYFSFDELEYVLIETNGKMSILPKTQKQPPNREELNIKSSPASICLGLVIDGKIINNNMQKMNVSPRFLIKQLNAANFHDYSQLLLVTLDCNGQMYIQPKNGKYKVIQTNFKGGVLS